MRTYKIEMMKIGNGEFKTVEITARTRANAINKFKELFGKFWILATIKIEK